jgi:hypothetical protein
MDDNENKNTETANEDKNEVVLEFHDFHAANQPLSLEEVHLEGTIKDGNNRTTPSDLIDDAIELESDPMLSNVGTKASSSSTNQNISIWSIEYYQSYFNITTNQVLSRIMKTFTFPLKDNHFLEYVKENGGADIWAPFWIVTTLIVLLVISSNIGGLFNFQRAINELRNNASSGNGTSDNPGKFPMPNKTIAEWTADFSIISMGASVLYSYLLLAPMILYFSMKWKNINGLSLVESWSIYGYSFAIVVPSVIFCILNYGWLRWLLLLLSFAYSAAFLISNLMPLWRDVLLGASNGSRTPANGPIYLIGFIVYVVLLHMMLALFVRLYFYTYQLSYTQS